MNNSKGFKRYLGTHFTSPEIESHYSSKEGYWAAENFNSSAERKAAAKIANAEIEAIIQNADLTEYRQAWAALNEPVDMTDLDDMMAGW